MSQVVINVPGNDSLAGRGVGVMGLVHGVLVRNIYIGVVHNNGKHCMCICSLA